MVLVRETISQVDFLVKHTAYNSEEVVEWHNAFLEDNPEGTLGKVGLLCGVLGNINGIILGRNKDNFYLQDKMLSMYSSVLTTRKVSKETMRVCTLLHCTLHLYTEYMIFCQIHVLIVVV